MRDEFDTSTFELTLPRKVGRPPKFGHAMSQADRAARYRRSRATRATAAIGKERDAPDTALVDAIRWALSNGDPQAASRAIAELARRYPVGAEPKFELLPPEQE